MKPRKVPGFSGQRWPQYREEVEALIAILAREGVRSYLEVGCRYGDTFHAVGLALPKGSRCVACDLPAWRNGVKSTRHTNSESYLRRAASDLIARGRQATVIIGDSHHPDTVAKVRALGPFDAAFIDGDHTPEGVAADWHNYGPLARIVAFHDIVGKESASSGPGPLFERLSESHRHQRISVTPDANGIGVIWRD